VSEHGGSNEAVAAQVASKKTREQIYVDILEVEESLAVKGLPTFVVDLRFVGVPLVGLI
jgi:ABC-type anion transport system duplicated permease subunit